MAKYAMVDPSLLPMVIYPTEILTWTGKQRNLTNQKSPKVVIAAK
jgi:hypothetical protein